jgi:DNA-binding MarR family transcriptional regulator
MTRPRSPQFGAILFRSGELIAEQGAHVFDRLGVGLHASRISIVLAIHKYGALSSSQLARHIGISRQLIEARLKASVADGFFVSAPDPNDSRKRIYDFAESSREEVARIVAIMIDFEAVYDSLWEEIDVDLETALLAMEKALKMRDLTQRLIGEFPEYQNQLVEKDDA